MGNKYIISTISNENFKRHDFSAQLCEIFENLSERISGISKGVLPGTEGEEQQKRESNMKSP